MPDCCTQLRLDCWAPQTGSDSVPTMCLLTSPVWQALSATNGLWSFLRQSCSRHAPAAWALWACEVWARLPSAELYVNLCRAHSLAGHATWSCPPRCPQVALTRSGSSWFLRHCRSWASISRLGPQSRRVRVCEASVCGAICLQHVCLQHLPAGHCAPLPALICCAGAP